MKTVALINHGCAKNLVDSELMLGILSKDGFKITLDETKAEIVIINTCSFIADAEKESVQSIIQMVDAGKKVIIAGCLAQKHKKELKKLIPEAVAFVGVSDFKNIGQVVSSLFKNDSDSIYDVSESPCYSYPEEIERQQITVGASSYIKIAEGCNFECGYCIIPKLRGRYTSRPIEKVVDEAKMLAQKGVSEIVLIAQDTTSYGIDLYKKSMLSELLKELNKIEDINWIRVMYAYPSMLTDEFLYAVRDLEKVVKYIDIPLQHSSKNVLKLMKRPVQDYKKLIDKIRKIIPGVALRTTFIVGYPGETEENFEDLRDFIEYAKFDKLGVFEFSKEKDTYAYGLKNQVPARIKKQRKNKLMKIQQKISQQINSKMIGKNIDCIVESITSEGQIIARTYKDAPEVDGVIYIASEDLPMPGDIVRAEVTGANEYDLFGVI